MKKADKDEPEVPKITQQMTVMKWATDFDDHLHACLGTNKAPLAWITQASDIVPTISTHAAYIHSDLH